MVAGDQGGSSLAPDVLHRTFGTQEGYLDLRILDSTDPDAVRATLDDMIRNRVAMTSTLAVYELSVPNRPPLEQRMLDAMSPETREEYLTTRRRIAENPNNSGRSEEVLKKGMAYEREFVKLGGLLARPFRRGTPAGERAS